jgi:CheY-like chemotaxis protein
MTGVLPIQILLVEDSPGDISLTRHALKQAKVANQLNVVRDGEEAMAYLRQQAPFGEASRPELVLLDLNLPRKDGREVLAEMKQDPDLATIPVVVLTTSADEADVLKAYQLHANSYVTKPVELDKFLDAVRSIEGFWLSIVRLPGWS